MGWSGGTFSRARDWTVDEGNSVQPTATRFDEEDDNLATGINACLHKGGQNSPTANINFGGYKITNHATPAASGDVATMGYVDSQVAVVQVIAHGVSLPYTGTECKITTGIASGYDYEFIFESVATSSDDKNLWIKLYDDGGTTNVTGTVQGRGWNWANASPTLEDFYNQSYLICGNTAAPYLDTATGTHYPTYVRVMMRNPGGAATWFYETTTISENGSSGAAIHEGKGLCTSTAIDAIGLVDSAGGSITVPRLIMRQYARS